MGFTIYWMHRSDRNVSAYMRALLYLQKAMTLSPNSAIAWNNIAAVQEALGDKEAAERARAKASVAVQGAVQ
jgi:Flp pilus assembly protein TadD